MAVDVECVRNFGVTAWILLNGESTFRATRDFKELGVAKRSHATTSAWWGSGQPSGGMGAGTFEDFNELDSFEPKLFAICSSRWHCFSDCPGVRHSRAML